MAKSKRPNSKNQKPRTSKITKRLRDEKEGHAHEQEFHATLYQPNLQSREAVARPQRAEQSQGQNPQFVIPSIQHPGPVGSPPWNVLVIEDDPNALRQIKEYFDGRIIEQRSIKIEEVNRLDSAFGFIRGKKVDLVILDIYRGQAVAGGERVGERVLHEIKGSGFVSVIIYTNLPEGLEGAQNEFVRLVPKEPGGVEALYAAAESIFKTRVPQMHRAIVNHLDRALCQYMWGFVAAQWPDLSQLADRPEFLRVLLQRLAISFIREGVDHAVAEVFGPEAMAKLDSEKVHPAEFYVKPPIGSDPALGDIRLRELGGEKHYLAVLWPTCDMVSTAGREPKTDRVLCAKALPLEEFPEAKAHLEKESNSSREKLEALLSNVRKSNFGFADRFHFLPGLLDIPNLVADFQTLEVLSLNDVRKLRSLGILASPFAEQMGARFDRYRGRIGAPDLDLDFVIDRVAKSKTKAL
jgi:CheY-like chemotaxis protein